MRIELGTMKYGRWALHLTDGQLAATYWAAGELGTRIDEQARLVERGRHSAHFRVNIGLAAIRRAVIGRPLTQAKLIENIQRRSLGARASEARTGNQETQDTFDGSDLKSARWAEGLTEDQVLALLWAIGEVGLRIRDWAELDPAHVHGDRVRANIGLAALRLALSSRALSVGELEEAFRVGRLHENP
ncbi:MAG TPA: hypothetical protein VF316_06155 [Polyangiaceae bacterium]